MYRMLVLLVVSLGLVGMAMLGSAQPPPGDPDGKGGPGGFDKGPPMGEKGAKGSKGGKGGKGGKGMDGKAGFQPGMVLPPHVVEQLNLSKEQSASIKNLETDVKGKLEKILTPEQLKKIREARPPGGPGGPGGLGGPGGPGGPGAPGEPGGNRPARPGADDEEKGPVTGGIQWFSTWQSAKAEAARTGRPILLVAAAPHCAGIPGIW